MEDSMKKKTTTIAFMVGMLLYFAGSAFAAWVANPENCVVPSCCQTVIGKQGWQFQLIDGPTPVPSSERPEYDADGNLITWEDTWKYTYEVIASDNTAAQSSILFTIPYAGPEEYGYKQVALAGDPDAPDALFYYTNAVGDPTTYFAQYVQQIRVAKVPPSAGQYIFYSNVGTVSLGTGALKSGKDFGSCAIAVPDVNGYDSKAVFTLSSVEYISTSDGKVFRIVRDADTQCIIEGCEWDNTSGVCGRYLTSVPIGEALTLHNDGVDSPGEWSGSTNQKCNEAIFKSEGDHTWVWVSGTRVWK